MLDGVEPELQPCTNPVRKRRKGSNDFREAGDDAKRPF